MKTILIMGCALLLLTISCYAADFSSVTDTLDGDDDGFSNINPILANPFIVGLDVYGGVGGSNSTIFQARTNSSNLVVLIDTYACGDIDDSNDCSYNFNFSALIPGTYKITFNGSDNDGHTFERNVTLTTSVFAYPQLILNATN